MSLDGVGMDLRKRPVVGLVKTLSFIVAAACACAAVASGLGYALLPIMTAKTAMWVFGVGALAFAGLTWLLSRDNGRRRFTQHAVPRRAFGDN